LLQEGADVGAVVGVPVVEHDLEAASQRVAEVAVTDNGVEVTEFFLVVHCGLRDGADDVFDVGEAGAHLVSFESRSCRSASRTYPRGRRLFGSARTVACSPSGSPRLDTTRAAPVKS